MQNRLFILVSYDVATESEGGKKRLRKVAKICEAHGQRVQKSVFECRLTLTLLEDMERKLLKAIDMEKDNLRLYRMSESANWNVKEYGIFKSVDFDGPLVI